MCNEDLLARLKSLLSSDQTMLFDMRMTSITMISHSERVLVP
jgi:hypothetical protein